MKKSTNGATIVCLVAVLLLAGCAKWRDAHARKHQNHDIQVIVPPHDQLVYLGNPATFTVSAQPPGLTYQWLFNGVAIPGATATNLTIPDVQASNLGAYEVSVAQGMYVIKPPAVLLSGASTNGAGMLTLISYPPVTSTVGDLNACAPGTVGKLRFPPTGTVIRQPAGPYTVFDPNTANTRFSCVGNAPGAIECGTNGPYTIVRWPGTSTYFFVVYFPSGAALPGPGVPYSLQVNGFRLPP